MGEEKEGEDLGIRRDISTVLTKTRIKLGSTRSSSNDSP